MPLQNFLFFDVFEWLLGVLDLATTDPVRSVTAGDETEPALDPNG
jgi:hypothetical protein